MTTDVDQVIADAVTFSARLGLIQPDSIARNIRSALAEAGYRIEPDNGWEWGTVNTANGGVLISDNEEHARRINQLAAAHYPVVRRHPATEWESAE